MKCLFWWDFRWSEIVDGWEAEVDFGEWFSRRTEKYANVFNWQLIALMSLNWKIESVDIFARGRKEVYVFVTLLFDIWAAIFKNLSKLGWWNDVDSKILFIGRMRTLTYFI